MKFSLASILVLSSAVVASGEAAYYSGFDLEGISDYQAAADFCESKTKSLPIKLNGVPMPKPILVLSMEMLQFVALTILTSMSKRLVVSQNPPKHLVKLFAPLQGCHVVGIQLSEPLVEFLLLLEVVEPGEPPFPEKDEVEDLKNKIASFVRQRL